MLKGYLKKLVIADNVAIYVNQIFMLEHPSLLLLFAGSLAFAIQIYADFSAYTDIARASARLLGFHLIRNFRSPYLAISPSDFWRRWHISFSSWIRDYLYIPLGGSQVSSKIQLGFVLLVSLGLSGLWHGAAWNFIAWGIYHAILLTAYRSLGLSGKWHPQSKNGKLAACFAMFMFTIVGWAIFRASSMSWLVGVFTNGPSLGFSGQPLIAAMVILFSVMFYSLPLLAFMIIDRMLPKRKSVHAIVYGLSIVAIVVLFRDSGQDFIYFRF
jgi:D-alanyl-lipoteichoic acid acyltransferase DltB (MBOAT superfamily)